MHSVFPLLFSSYRLWKLGVVAYINLLVQEKLSVLDFVDKIDEDFQPAYPPSLESTPFKFIEEVNDLKDLASKLRGVNEFAVQNYY